MAASLDPGDPGILKNRGVALHGLGRYGEALEAFGAAVRLDDRDAMGHFGRYHPLAALERRGEAQEALKAAVALNPGLAPAPPAAQKPHGHLKAAVALNPGLAPQARPAPARQKGAEAVGAAVRQG